MRVLLVQPKAAYEHLASALRGERHDVRHAADGPAALAALEESPVDVVVVEHVLPGLSGHEVVRRIRAQEGTRRMWILVTNTLPSTGSVRAAFTAGADDYLPTRCGHDELLARIDGKRRMEAWARAAGQAGDVPRVDSLRAWQDAKDAITATIGDMLGTSVESTPIPEGACTLIAEIPLVLARDGFEISMRLGTTLAGARQLGEHLLARADAAVEETQDMLREIANLGAGVWKRLAAAEGVSCSLGLPRDTDRWFGDPARARVEWAVATDDLCILHVGLELRPTQNELVAAEGLREGMILANNVHNSAGAVLLRSGTRLTESHLVHLVRALGRNTLVEVSQAA